MNTFEIDDLLEQMAIQNIRHFSPHYLCHHLSITNIEAVTNYLLSLVNKKLIAHYEVQCPNGHTDYSITDPTKIDLIERECEFCGESYIPDPEDIWITFDFTEYYLAHIQKKNIQKQMLSPVSNTDQISLNKVVELPQFKENEALLKKYCADQSILKEKFQKVIESLTTYKAECSPKWPKGQKKTITSTEVGDTLEDLAHYIFSCTSGIFIPKGSWANEISQIDNILYVTCHQCFLINWETYSIVECKNWSKPLGKQGVNDFIAKLRDSNQKVGIIFSQEDITGSDELRDAQGKLLLAAHDGIIVLVLTKEDLQLLVDGKNVFELLEQKYFERCLSPA